MKFKKYHDLINEVAANPDASYYPPFWWEQEIALFASDIPDGIEFIDQECSDEEIYWLSEVFTDLITRTHSKELLKAFCRRAEQVVNKEYREDINKEIKYAEEYLQGTVIK